MKLFYYQDPIGNFGDDLNPLIWYKKIPTIFDDDPRSIITGIGTLINSRTPTESTKYVFGSGVGYHDLPAIDSKWKFCFVRGPLSAEKLGLDNSFVATDPAILLAEFYQKNDIKKDLISFMPHHQSKIYADWKNICKNAGIVYLDPAANINETIFLIQRSKLVIAEAMHAAIVADALRVCWHPVICYDHILEFKWLDWCKTLNLTYSPTNIPRIWDIERNFNITAKFKTGLKRIIKSTGTWSANWTPPPEENNRSEMEDIVVRKLQGIYSSSQHFLSSDKDHSDALELLNEKIYSSIKLINKN